MLGVKRMAGLEINQVWADSGTDQKALRIVIDTTQGTGPGSGAAAFEIVVDNTVVWSIDKNGNKTVGGDSAAVVNATAATLTVTAALHAGRIITLNRAAGIAVTLPAATGSGAKYTFIVGTTITSNSTTIKVADASDIMAGNALQSQDGGATLQMWEAGASDDTITFNGSTTGGIKGDIVELIDIAADTWFVRVTGAATGTEATPFSATV